MSVLSPLTDPVAAAFIRLPGAARAAIWAVLGSCCTVGFASIAKHLSGDLPVAVVVFFRCLFGLIFLGPWLMRVRLAGLASRRPVLLMARGFNSLLGLFFMFWAVSLIAVADVMAIMFSKPVVAALAAVMVLGETMYRSRWIATGLALAGMVLIVRPGFAGINAGVLFALGAMACASFTAISVKLLTRTEPPDRIVAYTLGCMMIGSAVPAVVAWQTPTLEQFAWLMALGAFANGFQRCMARSFAAADATVVMPFEFTRLIVAAIVGYLAFGETSDVWIWSGGAVVFAAAIYMVRTESRRDRAAARLLAG
jgi:drug/metabolite transporter (DMT)-like permease